MGESGEDDGLPGYVFISYVRENSREVDDLQRMLEDAGIKVWSRESTARRKSCQGAV